MIESLNKIIIVDDHPVLAQGLEMVINAVPGCTVVAKCTNHEAAINAIKTHNPTIALVDIVMPEKDGYALIKTMNKHYPTVKIIVFTMLSDIFDFNKALAFNVAGYLVKGEPASEVVRAIEMVLAGQTYYSSCITIQLCERLHANAPHQTHQHVTLTQREIQVLRLIYQEKTTKEIGNILHLAFGTIETYRNSLLKKLGCNNMVGLIKTAQERGLI